MHMCVYFKIQLSSCNDAYSKTKIAFYYAHMHVMLQINSPYTTKTGMCC